MSIRRSAEWSRTISKGLVVSLCAFTLAGSVFAKDDDDEERGRSNRAYSIGLWGDLPYSDLQAQTGVPNLIADMNKQDLKFTIHNGDLKAGSGSTTTVTPTTCSNAMYAQALGFFNSLRGHGEL